MIFLLMLWILNKPLQELYSKYELCCIKQENCIISVATTQDLLTSLPLNPGSPGLPGNPIFPLSPLEPSCPWTNKLAL